MKLQFLITLLLLGLAGCSTFKGTTSTAPNRTGESPKLSRAEASPKKLSSALQELDQGRQAAAVAILEEIIAGPSVKGVTDEALFRLSVLKLFNAEKDESASSIRYLERLRHEYGDSRWTMQAKPLLAFLYAVADTNNQNRNLKAHNSSLSKENKELHKSLKRLKNLEIQTELNSR